MSLKNSNDTIGNRTRDLLVCSVVTYYVLYRVKSEIFSDICEEFIRFSKEQALHFSETSVNYLYFDMA